MAPSAAAAARSSGAALHAFPLPEGVAPPPRADARLASPGVRRRAGPESSAWARASARPWPSRSLARSPSPSSALSPPMPWPCASRARSRLPSSWCPSLCPPSGLSHHHDPVASTRHGPGHDEQRARGIGPQDLEVADGHAIGALVRRHPETAKHTAGSRSRADRALPAQVVGPVRLRAPSEVVQVHRTLEAFSLRDPAHVHLVAGVEPVDADLLPRREAGDVVDPDLAEHVQRRQILEVTALTARQLLLFLCAAEPELDGRIAVTLPRAHLRDHVRLGGDHGRRDDRAVLLEVLEHADLPADQHRFGDGGRCLRAVQVFDFRLVSHLPQALELDLDVDARWKVQLHQRVDGLLRRIVDVDEPLVRPDLELVARVLVDERAADHGELLDARGQRDRTGHGRPGPLRRLDDLRRGLVDELVVVRLEPDPDPLLRHYSMTFVTTPAPTVLPPSRIANRRPSSRAIGVMSVIVRFVLSPGMTISTPCWSSAEPVTSVVRM